MLYYTTNLSDTEMKMEMSDYYVARMSTWDSIYRYPEGENQPE